MTSKGVLFSNKCLLHFVVLCIPIFLHGQAVGLRWSVSKAETSVTKLHRNMLSQRRVGHIITITAHFSTDTISIAMRRHGKPGQAKLRTLCREFQRLLESPFSEHITLFSLSLSLSLSYDSEPRVGVAGVSALCSLSLMQI